MKFTVKVRGTVDHGEWKREDFMAGRAGEGIAASIRAYRREYELEANSAQEAAEIARAELAADDTIDELWVSPSSGVDVFDRQADFIRHEETMP